MGGDGGRRCSGDGICSGEATLVVGRRIVAHRERRQWCLLGEATMAIISLMISHRIQNGGCWHRGSRFHRVAINTTVSVPVSVSFLCRSGGR